MKKLLYSLPIVLFGLLFSVLACRHEIPISIRTGNVSDTLAGPPGSGGGPGNTVVSCSADTVYFVQSVLPLLTSGCAQSGCHNGSSGGDAGDYTLNTYAGIMALVTPGNAAGSRLISITSSGRMPPRGYAALTADQIAMLTKWINQGAPDNSCTPSTCDTSQVAYASTIVPILQTNCTGCHSGSAAGGGGIDLTQYANVLTQVSSGKLWGDIKHLAGYNAMPLGGGSLSSCDLSKINTWIRAGAPNN